MKSYHLPCPGGGGGGGGVQIPPPVLNLTGLKYSPQKKTGSALKALKLVMKLENVNPVLVKVSGTHKCSIGSD